MTRTYIYLDHAATTPMRPEVFEAMRPHFEERFGNPSSVHGQGRASRTALEEARARLAAAIGARRRDIVFTGGGTEADNLAVLGAWRRAARRAAERGATPPAVACSAVEHSAVLRSAEQAAREGAVLIVLAVDANGTVQIDALDEALSNGPAVVSVMWGNNEVGTLQPVHEIATRCDAAGAVFHTDAVQALGKVRVRVDECGCHLLTMSSHKLGGPQGVGALYIRPGTEIDPVIYGGGQENGIRSGTHNVAGAVGMAVAAELAVAELEAEAERIRRLRDRLQAGLLERIEGLDVHAADCERLPQILNVSVRGIQADAALLAMDAEGLCVSTGSACKSGSFKPSHVLSAMGRFGDPIDAQSGDGLPAVIRFSLGRTTDDSDVDAVIARFPTAVARLRELALT
ncbi:MAG TPA: cysteine desulfurase family protein [Longimicrobiales bacterium]|nr:cysteine desulfurase family protein [Longimicrobiales bacterium]